MFALREEFVGGRSGEPRLDIIEVAPQFGANGLGLLQFATHAFDARVERVELLLQAAADFVERFAGVAFAAGVGRFERALEHLDDTVQRKAERSQAQDATESLEIAFIVQAIAALAPARRDEAAFLVILQRARRDAEALGGVTYGQERRGFIGHARHYRST